MAKRKSYRFALYLLVRAWAWFILILPRDFALFLAERGARLSYWIIGRQRKKTLENLRQAYGPEKTPAEIETLAKKVFENFALTAVEVLQFKKLNFKKVDKFHKGEDCTTLILGIIPFGTTRLVNAVRDGNMNRVWVVDYEQRNFILFQQICVTVYGV